MPKFCPTCGNSSDKVRFYGNFCENCTKQKFSEHLKESAEVIRCKRCGRIRVKGVFVPPNGKTLANALEQNFKGKEITLIDYSEDGAQLDISDTSEEGTLGVEHDIKLTYKKVLCDVCYKKACNYHEATIQLRGNPDKIEKFMQKLTKFFEMNNEFISKIESTDNGLDVYVSSKALCNTLMSTMQLHPNKSFTLAGVKNGKRVYKNTYALHY